MSLHDLARTTLESIMKNERTAFSRSFSVTDPEGTTASFYGRWNHISQAVDQETGAIITGEFVSAVIVKNDLVANGLTGVPEHIEDGEETPWLFEQAGKTYKVFNALADETMGTIVVILEPFDGN